MAKTENRPQRTCLLLVLMIVGIASIFAIGAAAYIFWRDNQPPPWWDDLSKISVEFSDPLATPQIMTVKLDDLEDGISEIMYFTYVYDGEEHFPEAKIIVDGKKKGYICIVAMSKYNPESLFYNPTSSIVDSGKYAIFYELYKDEDERKARSYFYELIIDIDII